MLLCHTVLNCVRVSDVRVCLSVCVCLCVCMCVCMCVCPLPHSVVFRPSTLSKFISHIHGTVEVTLDANPSRVEVRSFHQNMDEALGECVCVFVSAVGSVCCVFAQCVSACVCLCVCVCSPKRAPNQHDHSAPGV